MKIYKTKVHNITKETEHLNNMIKKQERTEKLLLYIVAILFVTGVTMNIMHAGISAEKVRWEDKPHPTPYAKKTLTWVSETEKRRIK